MSYTNLRPLESSNARITVALPSELDFVSALNGGIFNAATRTITWSLGTVNVNFTGTARFTTRARQGVTGVTVITNQAAYTAAQTVATPAAGSDLAAAADSKLATIVCILNLVNAL